MKGQLAKAYVPTFAVIANVMLGVIFWITFSAWAALLAMVCAPLFGFIAFIAIKQPTSGEG